MSDIAEVVASLQDGSLSSILLEPSLTIAYMTLDFNHVIFDHCIRKCNQVAHELAKLARFSPTGV